MNNPIINVAVQAREFFGPWFALHLHALQISSLILSGIFLWAIIYITIKSNYWAIKEEQFMDMLGKGDVSKTRSLKAWQQIKERLATSDPQQWKLAILEADKILNNILKMSGYLGQTLEDKLELITPAQLANVEDVVKAHRVCHKISTEPDFMLTQEEALTVMTIYRDSFRALNLIDE